MSFNIRDIKLEKIGLQKIFAPCPPKSNRRFWDHEDEYEFNEDKTKYKYAERTVLINSNSEDEKVYRSKKK